MNLKDFIISYQIRNNYTHGFYHDRQGTQLVIHLNQNGIQNEVQVVENLVNQFHEKGILGKNHLYYRGTTPKIFDFSKPSRDNTSVNLDSGNITDAGFKCGRVIFFLNPHTDNAKLHGKINRLLEPQIGPSNADEEDTYKSTVVGVYPIGL